MLKAKKYDWKDSNLALFGSDTEKQVKKESAASEPAWKGAGAKVGTEIWRIVKFKVTKWPKEDYGKFYNGDSYIVLNTYKTPDSDALKWDVHFWIGKYSTQDEYGTAAYKTVELDTLLDDAPVQHREVQGYESALFKSYFDWFTIMKGGADSGFRHVTPEAYEPRLFQVMGEGKQVLVKEIPCKRGNLKSGDVFIIDEGTRIYQWNGETSNKDERFRATQYVQKLKSERMGKARLDILEESSISPKHPCYKSLKAGEERENDEDGDQVGPKELYRVSDAAGKLNFEKINTKGNVAMEDFVSDDVFLLDCGNACFVWIGKGASIDERKNAMSYAHNHLRTTSHPCIPVTVISEGQRCVDFEDAM